jgi:cytochrome c biogenesis protein CcdA
MTTILFTLSMSLFDSLSTTTQIIVFILILTTNKPIRNSLWYLAGLSGAYIACGIGGYLTLDQLRVLLGRFLPTSASIPDAQYYLSELVGGLVMVAIGYWYYHSKKNARPGKTQNLILTRLKAMNSLAAFGIGALFSVSSFPMSVPYIISLGKYALLHVNLSGAAGYILLYNFGYALPMLIVLGMYLFARSKADIEHDTLHEKARRLNLQLTTWAFAGFGIFSMIDAGCFFAFGHALIKGRVY